MSRKGSVTSIAWVRGLATLTKYNLENIDVLTTNKNKFQKQKTNKK
jgi:hypothetical protein